MDTVETPRLVLRPHEPSDLDALIEIHRWGNGFATEAARATAQYGFEVVGMDHLISIIHPENMRSIRVAQKIGQALEREDTLDGALVHIYGMRR